MDRYEVLQTVGEGTYGVVLQCRDVVRNHLVAVKRFKHFNCNAYVRRTMARELRAQQLLRGEPYVVHLQEAFKEDGTLHLVMDYIEHTLLDVLDHNPDGLDRESVRRLLLNFQKKTASAPPPTRCGDTDRSSSALSLESEPLENDKASMTDYVATRWYRSPEMLLGFSHYSFPVDLWAVGAILAEACDGQPLLPGKTEMEQIQLIQSRIGPLPPSYAAALQLRAGSKGFPAPSSVLSSDVEESIELDPWFLENRFTPYIGDDGVDLMRRLLCIDSKERISVEDALQHPFFEGLSKLLDPLAGVVETSVTHVLPTDTDVVRGPLHAVDLCSPVERPPRTGPSERLTPTQPTYETSYDAAQVTTSHGCCSHMRSMEEAGLLELSITTSIEDELIKSAASSPTGSPIDAGHRRRSSGTKPIPGHGQGASAGGAVDGTAHQHVQGKTGTRDVDELRVDCLDSTTPTPSSTNKMPTLVFRSRRSMSPMAIPLMVEAVTDGPGGDHRSPTGAEPLRRRPTPTLRRAGAGPQQGKASAGSSLSTGSLSLRNAPRSSATEPEGGNLSSSRLSVAHHTGSGQPPLRGDATAPRKQNLSPTGAPVTVEKAASSGSVATAQKRLSTFKGAPTSSDNGLSIIGEPNGAGGRLSIDGTGHSPTQGARSPHRKDGGDAPSDSGLMPRRNSTSLLANSSRHFGQPDSLGSTAPSGTSSTGHYLRLSQHGSSNFSPKVMGSPDGGAWFASTQGQGQGQGQKKKWQSCVSASASASTSVPNRKPKERNNEPKRKIRKRIASTAPHRPNSIAAGGVPSAPLEVVPAASYGVLCPHCPILLPLLSFLLAAVGYRAIGSSEVCFYSVAARLRCISLNPDLSVWPEGQRLAHLCESSIDPELLQKLQTGCAQWHGRATHEGIAGLPQPLETTDLSKGELLRTRISLCVEDVQRNTTRGSPSLRPQDQLGARHRLRRFICTPRSSSDMECTDSDVRLFRCLLHGHRHIQPAMDPVTGEEVVGVQRIPLREAAPELVSLVEDRLNAMLEDYAVRYSQTVCDAAASAVVRQTSDRALCVTVWLRRERGAWSSTAAHAFIAEPCQSGSCTETNVWHLLSRESLTLLLHGGLEAFRHERGATHPTTIQEENRDALARKLAAEVVCRVEASDQQNADFPAVSTPRSTQKSTSIPPTDGWHSSAERICDDSCDVSSLFRSLPLALRILLSEPEVCLASLPDTTPYNRGMLQSHLQALQGAFPLTALVSQDARTMTISVEDNINGYQVGLIIRLSNEFPRQPPRMTLPYSGVQVPVLLHTEVPPTHRSTSYAASVPWDPARPDLIEATHRALRVAYLYWGKVAPPTVQMLTSALARENVRMLQDLANNPNKLDMYAYQHPMTNAMRSASQDTLQELENLVTANTGLRHSLGQQQSKVVALQEQLRSRLSELSGLEQNRLFASVCTPEAIKRTLSSDVATLEERSRQLLRVALDTPPSSKRPFEEAVEQYRNNAKELHLLQLKLTEYEKQVPSTTHSIGPPSHDTFSNPNRSLLYDGINHLISSPRFLHRFFSLAPYSFCHFSLSSAMPQPPTTAYPAMPVQFAEDAEAQRSSASRQQPVGGATPARELCMSCKRAPISYKTDTCQHGLFCKDCAMKFLRELQTRRIDQTTINRLPHLAIYYYHYRPNDIPQTKNNKVKLIPLTQIHRPKAPFSFPELCVTAARHTSVTWCRPRAEGAHASNTFFHGVWVAAAQLSTFFFSFGYPTFSGTRKLIVPRRLAMLLLRSRCHDAAQETSIIRYEKKQTVFAVPLCRLLCIPGLKLAELCAPSISSMISITHRTLGMRYFNPAVIYYYYYFSLLGNKTYFFFYFPPLGLPRSPHVCRNFPFFKQRLVTRATPRQNTRVSVKMNKNRTIKPSTCAPLTVSVRPHRVLRPMVLVRPADGHAPHPPPPPELPVARPTLRSHFLSLLLLAALRCDPLVFSFPELCVTAARHTSFGSLRPNSPHFFFFWVSNFLRDTEANRATPPGYAAPTEPLPRCCTGDLHHPLLCIPGLKLAELCAPSISSMISITHRTLGMRYFNPAVIYYYYYFSLLGNKTYFFFLFSATGPAALPSCLPKFSFFQAAASDPCHATSKHKSQCKNEQKQNHKTIYLRATNRVRTPSPSATTNGAGTPCGRACPSPPSHPRASCGSTNTPLPLSFSPLFSFPELCVTAARHTSVTWCRPRAEGAHASNTFFHGVWVAAAQLSTFFFSFGYPTFSGTRKLIVPRRLAMLLLRSRCHDAAQETSIIRYEKKQTVFAVPLCRLLCIPGLKLAELCAPSISSMISITHRTLGMRYFNPAVIYYYYYFSLLGNKTYFFFGIFRHWACRAPLMSAEIFLFSSSGYVKMNKNRTIKPSTCAPLTVSVRPHRVLRPMVLVRPADGHAPHPPSHPPSFLWLDQHSAPTFFLPSCCLLRFALCVTAARHTSVTWCRPRAEGAHASNTFFHGVWVAAAQLSTFFFSFGYPTFSGTRKLIVPRRLAMLLLRSRCHDAAQETSIIRYEKKQTVFAVPLCRLLCIPGLKLAELCAPSISSSASEAGTGRRAPLIASLTTQSYSDNDPCHATSKHKSQCKNEQKQNHKTIYLRATNRVRTPSPSATTNGAGTPCGRACPSPPLPPPELPLCVTAARHTSVTWCRPRAEGAHASNTFSMEFGSLRPNSPHFFFFLYPTFSGTRKLIVPRRLAMLLLRSRCHDAAQETSIIRYEKKQTVFAVPLCRLLCIPGLKLAELCAPSISSMISITHRTLGMRYFNPAVIYYYYYFSLWVIKRIFFLVFSATGPAALPSCLPKFSFFQAAASDPCHATSKHKSQCKNEQKQNHKTIYLRATNRVRTPSPSATTNGAGTPCGRACPSPPPPRASCGSTNTPLPLSFSPLLCVTAARHTSFGSLRPNSPHFFFFGYPTFSGTRKLIVPRRLAMLLLRSRCHDAAQETSIIRYEKKQTVFAVPLCRLLCIPGLKLAELCAPSISSSASEAGTGRRAPLIASLTTQSYSDNDPCHATSKHKSQCKNEQKQNHKTIYLRATNRVRTPSPSATTNGAGTPCGRACPHPLPPPELPVARPTLRSHFLPSCCLLRFAFSFPELCVTAARHTSVTWCRPRAEGAHASNTFFHGVWVAAAQLSTFFFSFGYPTFSGTRKLIVPRRLAMLLLRSRCHDAAQEPSIIRYEKKQTVFAVPLCRLLCIPGLKLAELRAPSISSMISITHRILGMRYFNPAVIYYYYYFSLLGNKTYFFFGIFRHWACRAPLMSAEIFLFSSSGYQCKNEQKQNHKTIYLRATNRCYDQWCWYALRTGMPLTPPTPPSFLWLDQHPLPLSFSPLVACCASL
eukprot:gene8359-5854_t